MEKAAPQKPRRIKQWKALSSGNFKPMRKSHTGALDGCLLPEMADSLLICIESMVKQGQRLQRGTWVKKLENTLNIQFHQSIAEHFSWAGLENSEIPGELQPYESRFGQEGCHQRGYPARYYCEALELLQSIFFSPAPRPQEKTPPGTVFFLSLFKLKKRSAIMSENGRSPAGPGWASKSGAHNPGSPFRSCPAAYPPPGRPFPFSAAQWW